MSAVVPLAGAVLCGGRSRRMGVDKGSLRVGASTLLELVVQRLAGVADPIILVGDSAHTAAPLATICVGDDTPGRGPLGGVVAALRASPHELCAIVAVDMPEVSATLLRLLAAARTDEDAVLPRSGGRLQPLHAVYARTALPLAEAVLAEPDISLAAMVGRLRVRIVDADALRNEGVAAWFATNLNTPADVSAWRAEAARRRRRAPR